MTSVGSPIPVGCRLSVLQTHLLGHPLEQPAGPRRALVIRELVGRRQPMERVGDDDALRRDLECVRGTGRVWDRLLS